MSNAEVFDMLSKDIAIETFLKKDVCLKESYENWQRLLGFTIAHLNWLESLTGKKASWDAFKTTYKEIKEKKINE